MLHPPTQNEIKTWSANSVLAVLAQQTGAAALKDPNLSHYVGNDQRQ